MAIAATKIAARSKHDAGGVLWIVKHCELLYRANEHAHSKKNKVLRHRWYQRVLFPRSLLQR